MSTSRSVRTPETKKRKMTQGREPTSIAAHEMRNCLAGISGCLQVLYGDCAEDAPQKPILRETLSELKRLRRAAENFLFLAQPPRLELVPADINTIVREVGQTLRAELRDPDADVEFVPGEAPAIPFDPEQLHRALIELARHTLLPIGRRGRLAFTIRPRYGDGEVEIMMSGNSGAARDAVSGRTVSGRESLLGSGLAVGKAIVEGHGGRVVLRRKKGTVTRVSVFLKMKDTV